MPRKFLQTSGVSSMKKPRYTHGFVDRYGKARFYFRRVGFKRVPLPGLPWSPEFMAAYQAALNGDTAPAIEIGAKRTRPGTINAAIVGYYNSLAFRELAIGTQKMRRNILERFRAEHGDKRIATLPPRFIVKLLNEKRPAAARNWLKTLRGLAQFAVAEEMRSDDPTQGVKLPRLRSDGIHSWTETEITTFRAYYPLGSRPRLAFELLLNTAQRKSDVVRMGRQHVRGDILDVRQQKTGAVLQIPIHPDLTAALNALPNENMTFLVTEHGRPFSAAGFGNIFRDWCNGAGLPKRCSSHGLRKAACRRLAEVGCSEKLISAISGHTSLSEVQRYTRAADQARLARSAMDALIGHDSAKAGTTTGKLQK